MNITQQRARQKGKVVTCAKCGMEETAWTGNLGEGIEAEGNLFCCEGCAHGKDCICDSEITNVDFPGID